jgi:hypothetical protein
MKRSARLLLGAAALAAAGLYATPFFALHQIREAARAQDAQALAAYVDFPAVRESLKTGLRAHLIGVEPGPAQVLGADVAGALLGPMIDTLITPESLIRMLQGQPPGAAAASASGPATPQPVDTRMGYESPSRFVFAIKPKGSDDDPVELVLHREGLWGWKLAGLRIS